MKLKAFFASVAAAAALLVACTPETAISSIDGLEISNDYITLAAGDEATTPSATITLKAAQDWTASSKAEWITVTPASGTAGAQATVTISAQPNTAAARSAEVIFDLGVAKKIVKVNQKALEGVETPESTCKDVMDGDSDKTYKITGTITKISNNHYGNMYINDGTVDGDGVYIYGTNDKKGQANVSANSWDNFNDPNYENSWELAVGDVVTVQGPKTVYNGTVELVNVDILVLKKSLIDVEPFEFEMVPAEGAEFNLVVSAKESPLLLKSDADWLQILGVNADGSYKLKAEENTKTANRTAHISIQGPTALKSVEVIQAGVPAAGASVSEIIAMPDDSQVLTLQSTVVVALTAKGAVLSDGAKAIYAYGDIAADLELGDGVAVAARKTTYNGVPELTDITSITVDSEGNAVSHPEAKDITAEAATYAAAEAEFVKLTGTLAVSGNYLNLVLDGTEDKQGSIVNPVEELNAKSFDGKKITVTGYFNGLSGKGKYINIIATRIVEFVDNPKGTLRNPYGASELAQAILSGNVPEGEIYARGIINKIDNVNLSFGNAQYWLSDDGATADLEVYRGFWYGGEKFTAEDQIAVGDEVVVFGKVKLYEKDGNKTPEFDANNRIYTLNGRALPDGDGSAENPFNVTKLADMLYAGETPAGEVYAKGIISQIDNVNLNFGNAQYWLSDDGGTKYQMEVYRGFWFGGEKFTSEDQIALGDEVVVYGKVKLYVKDDNKTPEFDANNRIISLNGATQ